MSSNHQLLTMILNACTVLNPFLAVQMGRSGSPVENAASGRMQNARTVASINSSVTFASDWSHSIM